MGQYRKDSNQMENDFKIHTKRGGQIQNKQLNHEVEDILNLKKPRKLKILKIIFTILRHFFSSIYFIIVLLFAYFLKMMYNKYQKQIKVQSQDIKIL